jgi:hypothetical protein
MFMAHAVVAYRGGKSPIAKFVTLDEDEANKMVEANNSGGRGTTFYKVEEYNPDVHTGQPKMTPEAEAEIGPMAVAQGQLNRMKDGYNDQAELDGERPADNG